MMGRPAGWYVDPRREDVERWWDGAGWTAGIRAADCGHDAAPSDPIGPGAAGNRDDWWSEDRGDMTRQMTAADHRTGLARQPGDDAVVVASSPATDDLRPVRHVADRDLDDGFDLRRLVLLLGAFSLAALALSIGAFAVLGDDGSPSGTTMVAHRLATSSTSPEAGATAGAAPTGTTTAAVGTTVLTG